MHSLVSLLVLSSLLAAGYAVTTPPSGNSTTLAPTPEPTTLAPTPKPGSPVDPLITAVLGVAVVFFIALFAGICFTAKTMSTGGGRLIRPAPARPAVSSKDRQLAPPPPPGGVTHTPQQSPVDVPAVAIQVEEAPEESDAPQVGSNLQLQVTEPDDPAEPPTEETSGSAAQRGLAAPKPVRRTASMPQEPVVQKMIHRYETIGE